MPLSSNPLNGNDFSNNIIYYTEPDSLLFYVLGSDTFTTSDYNLFYTPNNISGLNNQVSAWRSTYNLDQNSIVEDPLFVDYSGDNFELSLSSSALGLGIHQIDVSTVGLE